MERAPVSGVNAGVYRCRPDGPETLADVGEDGVSLNCYSMTKSLFSLVLAHDMMNGRPGFDSDMDVSGHLRHLTGGEHSTISIGRPVHFRDLINHTAGINGINMGAPDVLIDLLLRRKDSHSLVSDYLTSASGGSPFNYSPVLGFMLAGMIYELEKRRIDPSYSIAEECKNLFFLGLPGYWEWPACRGAGICKHTWVFSQFQASRKFLRALGHRLLTRHSDVLGFISREKPNGMYVRRARSSLASGGVVEGTQTGNCEVMIDYDYSMGWWILPGRKAMCAIGLGGQYLVLDRANGVIGVRQQTEITANMRTLRVSNEIGRKRRSAIVNSHETFPLLAINLALGNGVDRTIETRLLLEPAQIREYYARVDRAVGTGTDIGQNAKIAEEILDDFTRK
jgi:hypothetical protein